MPTQPWLLHCSQFYSGSQPPLGAPAAMPQSRAIQPARAAARRWDLASTRRTFLAAGSFSFREASHMGTFALSHYALTVSAAATLLASSSGSQSPIGALGVMRQERGLCLGARREV
ncbi:MAG TPA: hypothetical protein VHR97_10540 [Candidatus Baltobacteraceae bacterium]|jgi:hypothetical protein|nr:hypothetical protein [Candidatus Baltobacteraceae bacterium]